MHGHVLRSSLASSILSEESLYVRAIYGYDGSSTGSLSFSKGDIIDVITQLEERGWFPSNYVASISHGEAQLARDQIEAEAAALAEARAREQRTRRVQVEREQQARMPASQSSGSIARSDSELENVLWSSINGLAAHESLSLDDMTSSDMFAEIAGAAAEEDDNQSSADDHGSPAVSSAAAQTAKPNVEAARASDYWMPRVTEDGQISYFNSRTGESSRDMPADGMIGVPTPALDDGRLDATVRGTHRSTLSNDSAALNGAVMPADGSPTRRPLDALPSDWVARQTEDGRVFYEDQRTGEQQWHLPASQRMSFYSTDDESLADAGPSSSAAGPSAAAVPPAAGPSTSRQRVDLSFTLQATNAFDMLQPRPADSLAVLEARANEALAELIDCVHPRRPQRRRESHELGTLDVEIDAERDRLPELMTAAVGEVRALLHGIDALFDVIVSSSSPAPRTLWPFAVPPDFAGHSARRPSVAGTSTEAWSPLRPYTRKMSSLMSKLVLSMRAVWGLMTTSEEEEEAFERSLRDLEPDLELEALRSHRAELLKKRESTETKIRWDVVDGARECSEAIVKIVEEIERMAAEVGLPGDRAHLHAARSIHGALRTSPLALLVPCASFAGNWRGNGYARLPTDIDPMSSLHRTFSRETIALLNATRKALAEESSELRAVLNTAVAKAAKRMSTMSTTSARSNSNAGSRPTTPAHLAATSPLASFTPAQSAARHMSRIASHITPVVQSLAAYLSATDDVDIAARVDIDIEADDSEGKGPQSSRDAYARSMRAATALLAELERSKQSLYDAGPALLLDFQGIAVSNLLDSMPATGSSHGRAQPACLSLSRQFALPERPTDPVAAMLATLISMDRALGSLTETLDTLMSVADQQSTAPQSARRASQQPRLQLLQTNRLSSSASSGASTAQGSAKPGSIAKLSASSLRHHATQAPPPSVQPSSATAPSFDSSIRPSTATTTRSVATTASKRESYNSAASSGGGARWQSKRESASESLNSRNSMAYEVGMYNSSSSIQSHRETLESARMRQTGSSATMSDSSHDSPTMQSPSKGGGARKLQKFFGVQDAEAVTAASINGRPGTAGSAREREPDTPPYLGPDYELADISYTMTGQVKGGTLSALVARLTTHESVDHTYISTFLMTFRTFASANQLLDLLFARFFLEMPQGLTPEEQQRWIDRKQKIVQIRTVNVLKIWVETHLWESDSDVVLPRVAEFASRIGGVNALQLHKVVESRKRNGTSRRMTGSTATVPPPPPVAPKSRKIKFLDLDPVEVARQLTLLDSRLCQRIPPSECLSKAWPKQIGTETPSLTSISNISSTITHWVQDTVLRQEDIRKRASTIKHFVLIAEACRKLQNFATLMSIIAGLSATAVHRLRRTWDAINQRVMASRDQLNGLMSPDRNFAAYREAIRSIGPPCVPFIGVWLTQWTFIGDGNADTLANTPGHINMQKRIKAAELIQQLQLYQSTPYNLADVLAIRSFVDKGLEEAASKDESVFYAMSLKLEPRERDDEKIARLLAESGFL